MLTKLPSEFREYSRHSSTLKRILNETHRSLEEISSTNLFPGENLKEQLLGRDVVHSIKQNLDCSPALLIFGQNCHAKALFINYILGQLLLPLHGSTWRWIRIRPGITKRIRLTLSNEFEIVEHLKAHDMIWHAIPEQDLIRRENEFQYPYDHCPTVEVELNHTILKDNMQIIIPPDCCKYELYSVLNNGVDEFWPVIVYVIADEFLNKDNIGEIRQLKGIYEDLPFLFISMTGNNIDSICDSELTESEQHRVEQNDTNPLQNSCNIEPPERFQNLRHQLESLGYISKKTSDQYGNSCCGECAIDNEFITENQIAEKFFTFVQGCLKSHLLKMAALLSEIHNNCLRKFILSAFDMAREIQITPRRILYAQAREAELYKTLMNIASEKQEEITKLIQVTLQDMKTNISEVVQDHRQDISHTISTSEIQQLVLRKLCTSVATQLVSSVNCLQDSFIGTLQRCLGSLEKNCAEQEINMTTASFAVKQILSAAYKIDLKSSASFSVVHTFWERLRNIIYGLQLPWSSSSYSYYDPQRRRQIVAMEMIDSLSASKLSRNISVQFKEHVKSSHEAFQMAMRTLENHLSGKLEQTEEQRIAIRKYHAPRFAKLALESTSMCDMVRWGMPQTIKEIGRGQYGVVFACVPWAGIDPCAAKSVVPPDERHWNDLAMEFYYTRTIPDHIRIVRLRGSVVDQSYGSGCSAVLLIMERMNRDLYCGLRLGLSWQKRLQIAIDVVEGIRYLHSQGLVHRDIKLKNVLLDENDRAKLTDFGFCIPEAMMSGSVVGTPVHMAPELQSGHYDSSVDVYAFGILFWYICAGHVNLPCVFQHFQNKEQLWTSVKKGIRPECLPEFNLACWNLMEQCWAAEPSCRPVLGYVQPQLEAIMRNTCHDSETDSL